MGEHKLPGVRSSGQFKTMEPVYDSGSKIFRQCISFDSKLVIPSEMAGRVVERACQIFAEVLGLNELHDFAWPPDQILFDGYNGGKGMLITLGTRADKRKPVILLQ